MPAGSESRAPGIVGASGSLAGPWFVVAFGRRRATAPFSFDGGSLGASASIGVSSIRIRSTQGRQG
ncbi:hypothetical protein BGLA2_680015 [Burkholderia gladioli]|nr:hypothetical protein BGLA2_680015 [Burkholderia gladioli]